MISELATDCLIIRPDARNVNGAAVKELVESIRAIGIINPLRVRSAGRKVNGMDAFEVTAGVHRLKAARKAGLVVVPCMVIEDDDLRAELAMIDENLMRAELSPAERAGQTARRKAIYIELHPETKHGENQHTRSGEVCHSSFADATASATGKAARTVRQDAERGEKVCEQALALVKGTELDTGSYLDVLKKLEPKEQVARVQRRLASLEREKAERKAARAASKPVIVKDDTDVEDDQYRALVNAWNKASPTVRMRFRENVVDVPVMDAAE